MLKIFFKGNCFPNKDGVKMTYNLSVYKDEKLIYQSTNSHKRNDGIASNNIADYCGFIAALKFIENLTEYPGTIYIYGSSNLVVQQMLGNWSINHGKYYQYAIHAQNKLKELCQHIDMPFIKWIEK